MRPEEIKIPRKKPSIIDQAGTSIYSNTKRPKRYMDTIGRIKGLETGVVQARRSRPPSSPIGFPENDYIENTYIDDYFE
jgi:hypothetical protein